MRGTMKRKLIGMLLATMALSFTACGTNTGNNDTIDGKVEDGTAEPHLEGNCADILQEIYDTATTEDDFFGYTDDYENVEITDDMEEYVLGTTDISFTDSVYSAPMMSSIAYQCVVLRVSEDQDVEQAKQLLEQNADPRKWVCVEAESVTVENVGDVILFIMADQDVADAAKEAFLALAN